MHRVLVIGSVHYDRIWRLESPLVPAGRLRVRDKTMVLGGGGFNTGSALTALGAQVVLVCRLMRDALGSAALETIARAGFDTQHVEMVDGESEPLDVLLDPNGERTILTPVRAGAEPLRVREPLAAEAAYLNAVLLDDSVLRILDQTPLVVSQLPLRRATPRPADYVVTSRADVGDDIAATWRTATAIAGSRLKALVVTDGPLPVTLYDGAIVTHIAVESEVKATSTIGAGDRFCGAFLLALMDGAAITDAVVQAAGLTAAWLQKQKPA
ncbi:MAG: carbohydrate kinase [Alphaproteobacteria bacterium]|nr:carbohydrate kinase [Alphaproteobacteria bacterium]